MSQIANIVKTFRELEVRFRSYSERNSKATHLAANVGEGVVQAGRLLFEAAELGAFRDSQESFANGWRNDTILRMARSLSAAKPLMQKDGAFWSLWVLAVGSWLAASFPWRFRSNATRRDWVQYAFDENGRLIDKDGKTLAGAWFKDGTLLPDDFDIKTIEPTQRGGYSSKLVGEPAAVTDFYDDADFLEHHRIRCEVHAAACGLVAELLEGRDIQRDEVQKLPTLQRHDREAWQASLIAGMTQQRIADELNRRHGTSYRQGQISRMIDRAKKHAEASGLADRLPPKAERERAMGPARLDLGKRTTGRTPRQTDKQRDE